MSLIDRFDASEFPTKFAAQIKDFSDEGWVDSTIQVSLTDMRVRHAAYRCLCSDRLQQPRLDSPCSTWTQGVVNMYAVGLLCVRCMLKLGT